MGFILGLEKSNGIGEIEGFFDGMGLPIPAVDEYYSAYGDKALVFLSRFGIVIRVTRCEQILKAENPHFLKPIFTRQAGAYEIDIDPGLICPVPYGECNKIYNELEEKYGIQVSDEKAHNLAYLPHTNPPYPIVIDLDRTYTKIEIDKDSLGWLKRSVERVRCLLSLYPPPPSLPQEKSPQDELYEPLREIISKAWLDKSRRPDPERIKDFFNACAQYKKEGKLLSLWENPDNSYRNTTRTAANYAKLLDTRGLPKL